MVCKKKHICLVSYFCERMIYTWLLSYGFLLIFVVQFYNFLYGITFSYLMKTLGVNLMCGIAELGGSPRPNTMWKLRA